MLNRSKCCIIGIPDHQAVINVGGRVGAGKGPKAIRKHLFKMKGRFDLTTAVMDHGDVVNLTLDVAMNHKLAATRVQQSHGEAGLSVVFGGGHDHGYSHLLGVSEALRQKLPKLRLGCINVDAHLDVRKPSPLITSGSPFYLALEAGLVHPKRFIEFGIQSHCNSPELWDYIDHKKVTVIPWNQLREGAALPLFKKCLKRLSASCDAVVVSLDMDAISSAFSPGVSAPQAEGLSSSEAIAMMEAAGREKKVVSLGIFELNPEHDIDERTARLAATAAFHFIESKFQSK